MVRIYYNEQDEKFFNDSLNESISYILGDNDLDKFEENKKEINESITELVTRCFYPNFYPQIPIGTTEYDVEGKTKINIVSTDSIIYENVLKQSYAHETSHSVISYINFKNSGEEVRVDRSPGAFYVITNYNGMLCGTDMGGSQYTSGNMFLELFIDFFSQIRTYGLEANKLISGESTFKNPAPTDYDTLYILLRMMIYAFQNKPELSIDESIRNHTGLLGVDNIFIQGIIKNPIMIYDEWSNVLPKDDYFDFAGYADRLFQDYLNTGELDQEFLIEIERSISEFAHERYTKLLNEGKITKEEFSRLNKIYKGLQKQFKKEFFGLKVKMVRQAKSVINNISNRYLLQKGV